MKLISWIQRPISLALRTHQISYVLSLYGIAGTLRGLGFEMGKRGVAAVTKNSNRTCTYDSVFGKNLAQTFVELGPTFIKLGQMLAQRPEWVGESVAMELRVLFDRVPPISYKKIEKILKKEWGGEKFKRCIRKIEKKALASASLSQTHTAVLTNGTHVILKVQKPGVDRLVKVDLNLMENAIIVLDTLYPKLSLRPAFNDFKNATLREIDYREEARNIDRFQKNNRSLFSKSSVIFPTYQKDLSTEKVIVLEPIRGKKTSEMKADSRVAKRAAYIGASAVLEQIFEHGFFHADPHAGNLFFLEDTGKIGFIDLGLVGYLEPEDRKKFTKVMLSIVKQDRKELAKTLFALGTPGKTTEYDVFEKGIGELLDQVKKTGIDNIKIEKIVEQLFKVASKNQLFIPNRYVLMIRSCLMIEGVAKQLDSKISLLGIAVPILTKSLIRSYNPLSFLRLGK
ncbi:MAG: AarF/ABC1/UbiB kinase family protein [Deltaproteobacteria bacterium]|nr:AarF/ABC1/UbiB kinase family protein [Deltaproteobacteria bacterium]